MELQQPQGYEGGPSHSPISTILLISATWTEVSTSHRRFCPGYDRRQHYPQQVQEAVRTITRQAGEAYDTYVERVAKNPLARTVKLADLRLNHATAPEQRLKQRYARAIERLERSA